MAGSFKKSAKTFGRIVLIMANILVGIEMIAASQAGILDGETTPVAGIVGMTYPLFVPAMLAVAVADALWLRKATIWAAVVFAVTLPMTVRTMPVNIPRNKTPEKERAQNSWTLLTYNVAQFNDLSGKDMSVPPNATMSYILNQNADVVLLQEAQDITSDSLLGLTPAQLDSVHARYPYISVGADVSAFSKFPIECLTDIDSLFTDEVFSDDERVGCFVADIYGEKVLFIGVHLQSIGLTDDDKELYDEITRGKGITHRDEIEAVKTDLLSKLAAANAHRARQAKKIVRAIDDLGIKDVVLAGDFNDVPGCYTYRQLEKIGLRAVFPEVGSGYKMTFNKNRFYFTIDHVFVRGNYKPWRIIRGNQKSSDHYPLFVTFYKPKVGKV